MGSTIKAVKVLDSIASLKLNGNIVSIQINIGGISDWNDIVDGVGKYAISSFTIQFDGLAQGASAIAIDNNNNPVSTYANGIENGKLTIGLSNTIYLKDVGAYAVNGFVEMKLCEISNGGSNYTISTTSNLTQFPIYTTIANDANIIVSLSPGTSPRWDKLKIVNN